MSESKPAMIICSSFKDSNPKPTCDHKDNNQTILLVQGKRFAADRARLMRKSGLFGRLCRDSVVRCPHEIANLTTDTIEALLHYVHTDEIRPFDHVLDWCKMYHAALEVFCSVLQKRIFFINAFFS